MKVSIQLSRADAELFTGKAMEQGGSLTRHLEELLQQQAEKVRIDDAKRAAMRRCARCKTLHLGIGSHGAIPQRSCQLCGKSLSARADKFESNGSAREYLETVAAAVSGHRAARG